MEYDVIIIGKGPAGISCSLYTSRAGLKTLVLGKDNSLLYKALKIDNYYGFSNSISGNFLLSEGESQSLRLGTTIITTEVISLTFSDMFEVLVSSGESYKGKVVLIATGRVQNKLSIANISKFEGKGVSYCAICDGYFYRKLNVGVIGFNDHAIHEAIELKTYTDNITIFTNGEPLKLSSTFESQVNNFKLNHSPIEAVEGSENLEHIMFRNGQKMPIDGLFVAYGSASSVNFSKKLGIPMDDDYIIVDKNQQTNIPGVFAAGDCTKGVKQISIAVGQGALAGIGIINCIKNM